MLENRQTLVMQTLNEGAKLAFGTLTLTLCLESCSIETVKNVWKQPKGTELYYAGVFLNIFNHIVVGIPLYTFAVIFFCSPADTEIKYSEFILEVIWVICIHSLLYYRVHKAFHESPQLFQSFHKFHHRYNTYVPPSSANAVSVGEYVVAYLIPFLVATALRRTQAASLSTAVCVVSVMNLLVHTPRLEKLYLGNRLVVTTQNHMNHHRKLNCHYASPTFNIDYMVQKVSSRLKRWHHS